MLGRYSCFLSVASFIQIIPPFFPYSPVKYASYSSFRNSPLNHLILSSKLVKISLLFFFRNNFTHVFSFTCFRFLSIIFEIFTLTKISNASQHGSIPKNTSLNFSFLGFFGNEVAAFFQSHRLRLKFDITEHMKFYTYVSYSVPFCALAGPRSICNSYQTSRYPFPNEHDM